MNNKSIIDAPYFEKDRPEDILDSNLSIHFWQLDSMYEEFWKTLTLEKAKLMLQILMSNSYHNELKPINMEKFILRSDYYCKKWEELNKLK